MRKALAVALMMALAAGLALGRDKGGAKPERKQRAKRELTEEQKKKGLERLTRNLENFHKRAESMVSSLEKSVTGLTDPETKKAVETAVAEGKTVVAGLESALNSAKQGDYDEATRVGNEVIRKARDLVGQQRTLAVKVDIDKYAQMAAQAGDNAEVAAAAQKVVDLSKKKLDLMAQSEELNKQLRETEQEIKKAQKATRVRKPRAQKPRAKDARRAKKQKQAEEGDGEAIE